jgi:hypothetical protein
MQTRSLIFSIIIFCAGFLNSPAKSYEIPVISVEVTINPDGKVRITEHRAYVFDGSFTYL